MVFPGEGSFEKTDAKLLRSWLAPWRIALTWEKRSRVPVIVSPIAKQENQFTQAKETLHEHKASDCNLWRQWLYRPPNRRISAAGRNRSRIEEAMRVVPGIDDAQYEIAEVEHDVESLTKLFQGRKVVCNTVGPFIRKADVVIEAALRAGCHYMDTTGEQPYMLGVEAKFGDSFRKAGLALIPSLAYMYADG